MVLSLCVWSIANFHRADLKLIPPSLDLPPKNVWPLLWQAVGLEQRDTVFQQTCLALKKDVPNHPLSLQLLLLFPSPVALNHLILPAKLLNVVKTQHLAP